MESYSNYLKSSTIEMSLCRALLHILFDCEDSSRVSRHLPLALMISAGFSAFVGSIMLWSGGISIYHVRAALRVVVFFF